MGNKKKRTPLSPAEWTVTEYDGVLDRLTYQHRELGIFVTVSGAALRDEMSDPVKKTGLWAHFDQAEQRERLRRGGKDDQGA